MERLKAHRRKVLTAAASCAVAGAVGLGGARQESTSSSTVSRDSFQILEGTEYETTVYETTADADGETVVVLGGMHGNEVAGYEAAGLISEWDIHAGTLVTIPEADAPAVEAQTRSGSDGIDLNRQFPGDETPKTEQARAIWDVVLEYDPDVVIDLHESTGIYAGNPVDGVGQAVFHSSHSGARQEAKEAADYVNENYVDGGHPEFMLGTFSGPNANPRGLLVHKASRDLGARSFLIETLSQGVDLETRVSWHAQLVGELTADALFSSGAPDPSVDDSLEEPDETESDDDLEEVPVESEESEEPEESEEAEEPEESEEDIENPEDAEESSEDTEGEADREDSEEAAEDAEGVEEERTEPEEDQVPEEAEASEESEESEESENVEDDGEAEASEDSPDESEDADEIADADADAQGSTTARPTARIEMIPADADEQPLRDGTVVTLDGSASCVPDGDIVCYEWDINDDGHFDHTGETIDVTISANGDYLITLRVTSDAGESTDGEILLTTE